MGTVTARGAPAAARRSRYERLYRDQLPAVTRYVRSRVAPGNAEDVIAEVFLVAWRRLDELPARPLPWLLVTARNTVSQFHRGESRADALATELERLHRLRGTGAPDPGGEVAERLTVLAAVAALSPADREAIALTAWDDLSTGDAAVVAGCSPAAFRVRLHRARRRLVRALEDDKRPSRPPAEPGRRRRGSVAAPVAPDPATAVTTAASADPAATSRREWT